VVKHARAKEVQITIRYDEGAVSMEISDDGVGFDRELSNQSAGFGLQGINERVQQLGGSLEIDSAPLKGTRLRVRIPIP
jgi:signal transduction histidine kinase